MNYEKISSDKVPGKFTEWLLAMGCPADKVPSQDKMTEMCRGQYHMVWRSLMEKADARDVVREKRLQVFCDDVRRCRKKNVFSQDSSTIVPEQLCLWKQQSDLTQAAREARARVVMARRDLDQLLDKISTKMAQRVLTRSRVDDQSRRVYQLQLLAAELADKKTNLQETRAIADSLCCHSDDDDTELQEKLDKCLTTYHKQTSTPVPRPNSSVSSNGDDFEQQVWQLVRSRGDALCARLYERRAALVQELSRGGESPRQVHNKVTPQSVLARSAALHCALSLEATKNKLHLKQTRKKMLATVTELNNYLSGELCELLVIRCEKTHVQARVGALRTLLDELSTNSGVFHTDRDANVTAGQAKPFHAIDKAIEMKRSELKRVISSLCGTQRKTHSARDCLQLILAAFAQPHAQPAQPAQPAHYTGMQLELPAESVAMLRRWYAARRARSPLQLSMELEESDRSLGDGVDLNNPTFVDELKIYLKKFSLEKNRQLVLESGEKIWIFESIQSSLHRLLAARAPAPAPLCAGSALAHNIARLARTQRATLQLHRLLLGLHTLPDIPDIDITPQKDEEQKIADRTKKRLRESLLELQKTNKIFVLAEDNLKLWSNNNIRKYISLVRKHDGMTYKDYEVYYIENCFRDI